MIVDHIYQSFWPHNCINSTRICLNFQQSSNRLQNVDALFLKLVKEKGNACFSLHRSRVLWSIARQQYMPHSYPRSPSRIPLEYCLLTAQTKRKQKIKIEKNKNTASADVKITYGHFKMLYHTRSNLPLRLPPLFSTGHFIISIKIFVIVWSLFKQVAT